MEKKKRKRRKKKEEEEENMLGRRNLRTAAEEVFGKE